MPADCEESSLNAVARDKSLMTCLIVGGVFLGVSLLSVPVPGVNEPHYLSKARSFVDPEWCEADFFLQSADAHAVFFALVGPLTKWLSFHNAILVGRALSLLLLGWGWSVLGRQLQLRPSAIVAAACCFSLIAMTGNFSGEWVIGGFESKVPAYGCALAAVAFWLRAWSTARKTHYAISGIMAGLAVSWHPVVGLWFCIGIAITEVLRLAMSGESTRPLRLRLSQTLANGCVFAFVSFVFAIPGLLPVLKVLQSANLPADKVDQANYIQVFWRLAHHLDPSTFPRKAWIHTGVLCCICLIGLLLLKRSQRDRNPAAESSDDARGSHDGHTWRPLLGLLLAAALTSAVGVAIGWHDGPALETPNWQRKAMLLKFYPFRFFDALLPIITSFVLAKLTVNLLSNTVRKIALLLLVTLTLYAGFQIRPHAPGGYTPETFASWKEACGWISSNTPSDSLIYGPREGFGLKLFAERAEYVCFKDCPQDAEGIMEWNRRLWAIHHWSQNAYQDSLYDESDLALLRKETGVTHILTKRLGPFSVEPVWENSHWRIYRTKVSDSVRRKIGNAVDEQGEK